MALLPLVAICWLLLFEVRQPDYALYLVPWLSAIRNSDGLKIFATDFTNYTGGYVTVLWLTERVDFLSNTSLSDLALIKITALLGSILCSIGVWSALKALDWKQEHAIAAAIFMLLLPEVLLNGVALAQAEALYTAFLAFTVAAMIREKPTTAVACFAVAISIKLPAIWLAPVMAGWLLRRPRAIVPAIIAFPIAYAAVNALYLVAGRPLRDVLLIYFTQFETFERLSMNAPNFWVIADRLLDPDWVSAHFSMLVAVGMFAAFILAIGIASKVYKLPQNAGIELVFWAALSSISMPFLLPKMHDRFFFAGGVFVYLIAVTDRRYALPAILIQFAALLSYSQYHDTLGLASLLGRSTAILLAVIFMTAALGQMLQLRAHSRPEKPLSQAY